MSKTHQPNDPPKTARTDKIDSACRKRLERLREDIDYLFHEIRTPLTAVINFAEFMSEHELPHDELVPYLQIIQKEGRRIDNLLNDFAHIYHDEASDWLSEMTFAEVAVDELLLDAAERFRNASPRHTILVKTPLGLAPVRGDRKKLDLVLRNLLANAIKYSPKGGTVELTATETEASVTIRVSDQGLGIPAECIDRIFNREFRADQPECRQLRGSGLGLALVRRIVIGHDGQVRVESRAGGGSSFFVTLPKDAPGR